MTYKIATFNETSLHAALKEWYVKPGDQLEVLIDGFQIDIVRGDLLVEIQISNFSSIKRKLNNLVKHHPVRLVYPLTLEKWLVKKGIDGNTTRRKSPRKGTLEHLFKELVSFPKLILNPNFSIDVLYIQEEEVRIYNSKPRGWRKKIWKTLDRRLLKVSGQRLFETPGDIAPLIPGYLSDPFTTADLSSAISKPLWLSQKMAYCLREMEVITSTGKVRNSILYSRKPLPLRALSTEQR
ncbi:MAG: hypothetical protein GY941_15470 [Planctomycetes bacterium]|nr:hypothetical protein [Planctomycetota bacterium]